MFLLLWVLRAAFSSDMPLVRGCCSHRAKALPALHAVLLFTSLRLLHQLGLVLVSREALGRGHSRGCGVAHIAAASSMSQAGAVLITPCTHACVSTHTHTQSPSQQCSRTSSRWLSRTMVCDESSLSWDDIETSEGDESVAAVAVGLLFCSWDSCGRNNCCPCFPQHRRSWAGQGGTAADSLSLAILLHQWDF